MFNDSIVQGIKKFEFDTILILKIENLLQQILFYTNGKLPGTELNTRQTQGWPGAFLYMPWILEWNIEEFKIHIHLCFKNICPKNIPSGSYERGQNSYLPLFKNIDKWRQPLMFSYFTDSRKSPYGFMIYTYMTKLMKYWFYIFSHS